VVGCGQPSRPIARLRWLEPGRQPRRARLALHHNIGAHCRDDADRLTPRRPRDFSPGVRRGWVPHDPTAFDRLCRQHRRRASWPAGNVTTPSCFFVVSPRVRGLLLAAKHLWCKGCRRRRRFLGHRCAFDGTRKQRGSNLWRQAARPTRRTMRPMRWVSLPDGTHTHPNGGIQGCEANGFHLAPHLKENPRQLGPVYNHSRRPIHKLGKF
jgi:hypothetical protein